MDHVRCVQAPGWSDEPFAVDEGKGSYLLRVLSLLCHPRQRWWHSTTLLCSIRLAVCPPTDFFTSLVSCQQRYVQMVQQQRHPTEVDVTGEGTRLKAVEV